MTFIGNQAILCGGVLFADETSSTPDISSTLEFATKIGSRKHCFLNATNMTTFNYSGTSEDGKVKLWFPSIFWRTSWCRLLLDNIVAFTCYRLHIWGVPIPHLWWEISIKWYMWLPRPACFREAVECTIFFARKLLSWPGNAGHCCHMTMTEQRAWPVNKESSSHLQRHQKHSEIIHTHWFDCSSGEDNASSFQLTYHQ